MQTPFCDADVAKSIVLYQHHIMLTPTSLILDCWRSLNFGKYVQKHKTSKRIYCM